MITLKSTTKGYGVQMIGTREEQEALYDIIDKCWNSEVETPQSSMLVCVQSFTFYASSHPITYLGAKPVFICSEKDPWNMDPELLVKAIIFRKGEDW